MLEVPLGQLRSVASLFLALGMFCFFLVLFIVTGGLQKTKLFATIPRVEMVV